MQNPNATPTAPIVPSAPPATINQPSNGFNTYPSSRHSVSRARYITSNDPRGYLPVYEYTLNNQCIMMDIDDGYVLWTSICKALGKSKADIAKMVENDPDVPSRIRKVKGGFLKVQGTWIPYDRALTLARKIAWPIRDELVPLFGPEFPNTCLSPNDPGYGEVSDNRRRNRRHTQPANSNATGSQSGTSTASPSPAPWQSSSPPVHQRRATTSATLSESAPGRSGYPGGLPASPRGGGHPGSPGGHGYHPYLQAPGQVGQRYSQASQTPSPTHTVKEEPYSSDAPYEPGYHSNYPPPQSYPGYGSGYGPSSYHGPASSYQAPPPQNAPYGAHHQPPNSQEFSQPATPTHYPASEYDNYASHGVSLEQGQPCDTYPHAYQQTSYSNTHGEEYGSHYPPSNSTYQPYSQSSRPPHHASYSYGPAESNVRFESGYGSDNAPASARGSGGEYGGYNYPSAPGGGHEGPSSRTYPSSSSSGQYTNGEYTSEPTSQQQHHQGYGSSYGYQYPSDSHSSA